MVYHQVMILGAIDLNGIGDRFIIGVYMAMAELVTLEKLRYLDYLNHVLNL